MSFPNIPSVTLPAVEHHAHVNNLHVDPEKATGMGLRAGSFSVGNILRVNPLDERKRRHVGQHVYFILYLMFYGVFTFISSMLYSITGKGTVKISKTMWYYRVAGFLTNFQMIIRYALLPMYLTGTFSVILNVSK